MSNEHAKLSSPVSNVVDTERKYQIKSMLITISTSEKADVIKIYVKKNK